MKIVIVCVFGHLITDPEENDLGVWCSAGPNRNRSNLAFSASLKTALTGVLGRPRTGPPPMIEAENGSKTFGFPNGRSERRSPSITGLVADCTFVAMIGGKGPWNVICGGFGKSDFAMGVRAGILLMMLVGKMISGPFSLRRSPPKNRWNSPVSLCCGFDCGPDGRLNPGWTLRFLRNSSCRCCSGRFDAGLEFLLSCSSCCRVDSCSLRR